MEGYLPVNARSFANPFFIFNALVVLFIAAPLVLIVVISFTPSPYLELPKDGLSLRWYQAVLNKPAFIEAFLRSIYLGLAAAIVSAIIGTLAAIAMTRYRFIGRGLLDTLVMGPFMVPMVVLGIAELIFLSRLRLAQTFPGLLAAHIVITVPFVVRTVSASLRTVDPRLEQAAMNLGASRLGAFRRITMPLIKPGLLAGSVFAFLLSFDNLAISLFIAGPHNVTLPVKIYYYIFEVSDPLTAAISTCLIAFSLLLMLLLERVFGLKKLFQT